MFRFLRYVFAISFLCSSSIGCAPSVAAGPGPGGLSGDPNELEWIEQLEQTIPEPASIEPNSLAVEILLDDSKSVTGAEGVVGCSNQLSEDGPFHKKDVINILRTFRDIFDTQGAGNFYIGISTFGNAYEEILSPVLASQLSFYEGGADGWYARLESSNDNDSTFYGRGFQDAYDKHLSGLSVDRKVLFILTDGFGFEDYPENYYDLTMFLQSAENAENFEIKLVLLCPTDDVEKFWKGYPKIQIIRYDGWFHEFFSTTNEKISTPHGWLDPGTINPPLMIEGDSSRVNYYFRSFKSDGENLTVEYKREGTHPDKRIVASGSSQSFDLSPQSGCAFHEFEVSANTLTKGFWWVNVQSPTYLITLDAPDSIINNEEIRITAHINEIGSNNQQWRQCYTPYLKGENFPGTVLQAFWEEDSIRVSDAGSSSYSMWKLSPQFIQPAQVDMEVLMLNKAKVVRGSSNLNLQAYFQAQPNAELISNNNYKIKTEASEYNEPQDTYELNFFFDYVITQPEVLLITTKTTGHNCPDLLNNVEIESGKYAKIILPAEAPTVPEDFWGKGYGFHKTFVDGNTYRYTLRVPWDTINPQNCAYNEIQFVWKESDGTIPIIWTASLLFNSEDNNPAFPELIER